MVLGSLETGPHPRIEDEFEEEDEDEDEDEDDSPPMTLLTTDHRILNTDHRSQHQSRIAHILS